MSMPSLEGAGKFDAQVEQILKENDANAVILMVFGENHGFSVATTDPEFYKRLPLMLRFMADVIDEKNKSTANQ